MSPDTESIYSQTRALDRELQDHLLEIAQVNSPQPGAAEPSPAAADDAGAPQWQITIRELRTRLDGLRGSASRLGPRDVEALRPKLLGLELRLRNLELAVDSGRVPPIENLLTLPSPDLPSQDLPSPDLPFPDLSMPTEVAPANDDCASATVIGDGTFAGDTTQATNDGQATCGASTTSPDIWFRYVAPVAGLINVDTAGSGYDTVLSTHSACPGTTLNQIACNDDSIGFQSSLNLGSLSAGAEVLIRVSGFSGDTGSVTLNVGPASGISGVVTEEGTGNPVSTSVILFDPFGFIVASDATDGSGFYEISGVPAATYFATTQNFDGFVDELYDDVVCTGGFACDPTSGAPLALSAGVILADVDFALAPGGTLSGTITAESTGAPLSGIDVDAYDTQGNFLSVPISFTNVNGTYTVEGLPTGDYFVVADPSGLPGFLDELYDDIPCFSCDPTSGTPVAVTAPNNTSGIDFALSTGGSISGTLTDEGTGNPLPGIDLDVFDAAGNFLSVSPNPVTDASGNYTIVGLPTGTYFVLADPSSAQGFIEEVYDDLPCLACDPTTGTPVAVTAPDVTSGIDFALSPGGSISGTITDEGTGNPLPGIDLDVFDAAGNFLSVSPNPITDASGDYTIVGLPTGTYFVLADPSTGQGFSDELYDDIPCSFCDPTIGTPVAVSAADDTPGIDFALQELGSVSGTVTDGVSGAPLQSIFIQVLDSQGNVLDSAVSDTDGTYTVPAVAPGTVFVMALSSFVDELYDDVPCPNRICSLASGTPVTVDSGADTPNIDFALAQDGFLSGSVTLSTTGIPLAGVVVNVFDSSGNLVASDLTDFTGTYSVFDLPAGSVFATTTNFFGFEDELYQEIPCPQGSCDPTTGTPIVILPNTSVSNIDFTLGDVVFRDGFESGDTTAWSSVN